jgi:hypothetical protein
MKYYKNNKTEKYANKIEKDFSALEAKNASKSLVDLFRDRKAYKIETFQTDKKKINFWEENYLYGRVNMNRDSVYPNEFNLLQLNIPGKTIFALNFVVDAFEEFRDHMKLTQANFSGLAVGKGSPVLTNISVEKAWQSLPAMYSEYLKDMSTAFLSSFLTPAREARIHDFESFVELYIESLDTITKHFPLSLQAFNRSRFCPVNVSGLVIEIDKFGKDDDEQKNEFLKDKNFSLFTSQARKFGFLVDKNCPYRLVADIFSPVMKEYMAGRGIPYDSNAVFEQFYRKTNELEVDTLSNYLAEKYNNYVLFKPTYKTYVTKTDNLKGAYTCKKTIKREPLLCFNEDGYVDKNSDYAKKYGDLFWLRFYFHLRVKEEKMVYSKYAVDIELKKIYDHYRVHGLNRAVDKINRDLASKSED